jgi:uncharacterized repeat protein (TIGR01451 family)
MHVPGIAKAVARCSACAWDSPGRLLLTGMLLVGVWLTVLGTASAAPSVPAQASRAVCPGPPAGTARCHALVATDPAGTVTADALPAGYGPAQFLGAYNLPTNPPTPQTIAIVDAFDNPTIESDLAVYNSTFGLPPCTTANGCFKKVNQSGLPSPLPRTDAGWALEIALDVETAHAICQGCKILLVEADSNSFANLGTAVNRAAAMGANVISNSYGGGEFSSETSDTAFNHPGIAVTVSTGDSGFGTEYPATSPYVIAVGGTTLNVTNPSAGVYGYGSETVWSGAGSGCSLFLSAQSWQTSDPNWGLTGCGTKRGIADVAADADPATGAAVYDTTPYFGQSGWFKVGGTSLAAPLIGAVYALAGASSSVSYPASLPYANRLGLHDVVTGTNGTCGTSIMCRGAVGYDGPTGLGTPNGLLSFSGSTTGANLALSASDSVDPVTADSAVTYTYTVGNAGPATATGVVLTINLPARVILGSVTPSQGTCAGAGPVTCSLGVVPMGATPTVQVSLTPVAPGSITTNGSVSGAESDPNPANNNATQSTVVSAQPNTTYVSVTDFVFSPKNPAVSQGGTVQWNFFGPSGHTVTDKTGMTLFDSGVLLPVTYFRYTYVGAGNYGFTSTSDTLNPMNGKTVVPLKVAPGSGTTATPFTLTWASSSAPAGFVFDVQVKRPGATGYANLFTAQTTPSGTFTPDAGPGTYSFRARMRKPAVGKKSAWSNAVSISVS